MGSNFSPHLILALVTSGISLNGEHFLFNNSKLDSCTLQSRAVATSELVSICCLASNHSVDFCTAVFCLASNGAIF